MKKIPGLSVTIIVLDEERDIEACLASVAEIAEEIVVVDSGSKDRTLEIAARFNARIFKHEWTGYSAQKQYAMDQAKGPWVLNIDADERVSVELARAIGNVLASTRETNLRAYEIPFHHYFLGTRLGFVGAQGEHHVRLFLKAHAAYGAESVHEGIKVSGRLARLSGAIDHFSYRDLPDYLQKCNKYTSLIAEKKFRAGLRFHWWHHLRLPYEFVVRYFLRLGFLDGEPGLTYALLSSYYVWLKFMKLRDFEGNE